MKRAMFVIGLGLLAVPAWSQPAASGGIQWYATWESGKREAERTGQTPTTDANEQLGQRVLSTLLGGLFGGAVIGWLLDKWLGTGHLLLVVMMVLGTVGGFWSIIKLSSRRP